MNIIVCVKRVPDDSVTIKLGADGKPAVSEVTQVVDSFDNYAVEMAVRDKEATGEGKVTVLSVDAIDAATPLLRSCLAVGADEAYCVNLTDVCTRGTSVAAIEKLGADLVLVGSESSDTASVEFGSRIANRMEVPFVPNVMEFKNENGTLAVKQETEDGYRMLEVKLPCVLSVVMPGYEPRYPSIKAKMAARKMPVNELTAADLGIEPHKPAHYTIVKYAEPAKREAGIKLNEEDVSVAVAKTMDILKDKKLV